ncbi:MAG: tRNA lysidine(34) synthetase TilS [Betaproteobacteria bacterium]|nr:tRNA lysidine(34) synthetase TilS [Betaproteobacteria bacterium]
MAGSRKSKPGKPVATALTARVERRIHDIVKTGDRLMVGLSGGVDSMVLLDVLTRLRRRLRFGLAAVHVNHQISPNASRWARFCREACRARDVPLRTVKVVVPRGDSVEAAARAARYDVFHRLRADFVVLAHTQNDQAETVLLQLLRGAGVKGLAAMPLLRKAEGKRSLDHPSSFILHPSILRPLLDVPRGEIERYARERNLEWIEDESNADTYFPRNFLRSEVLPLIARRFPAWRNTLARSAIHLAEAAELLDELARADSGASCVEGTLQVSALRRLSRARAGNLLRWFLARRGLPMPNAGRLEEALRQALGAKEDARVRIDLGDHELRRFAGALHVVAKTAPAPAGFSRRWRGEHKLVLTELDGVLTMKKRRGIGISRARIGSQPVTIRTRRGGERLQPDGGRPRRTLKNLFQELRIPPWQRDVLPLLFCGNDLVWAPGIGTDCGFQAAAEEPSIEPEWRRASA